MEENAARMLVRCARHLNQGKGKRPAQERILYLLRKNGKMTQKELQDAMQIRQGSMSEIMQKLESHGLIEKSRNPEDARSVMLSLSEEGRHTADENHVRWQEREDHLLDGLNSEEQKILARLCAKLLASWEAEHA